MKFPTHRKPRALAALTMAIACAIAGTAQAVPDAQQGEPVDVEHRALYRDGQTALQARDYADALETFRALERAQSRTSEPADAALYWQAYTLHELSRDDEARAVVERLRRRYPDSQWLDDARGLVPEHRRAEADADTDDRDEQALMAIDAILTTGNPKAVPLLERVLAGRHSDKVKSRAIFVLSQLAPERADKALDEILRGAGSIRLKREAIQMIGAGGRKASLDRLLPIYRDSPDPKLREAVLDAWLAGGRGDLVRDAARSETDPAMQRRAIQRLGAMGDSAAIRAMIPNLADERTQREAVQALAVAGDADALLELARGNSSERLKIEAVRSLGIVDREKSGDAIVQFYAPSQPDGVRRAAIQALMVNGDGRRLIELYRRETDPKLKRELLQAVTATSGDDAFEIIDDMLKEPTQ